MIHFLKLFFLLLGVRVPKSEAIIQPLNTDTVIFEDVKIGNRLAAPFKVFKKMSKTHCAKNCKIDPDCISFNFCSSLTCQLNSQDAFFPNASFIKTEGCAYQGVKRNASAECADVYFAECGLGGLKQQVEWNDWQHTVVTDSSDEWKTVKRRTCRLVFDKGAESCKVIRENILEWLKFVHEKKNWDEAKFNCENIGGRLFDSLNGTKSQLDFFYDKMNNASFWLGVRTEDHETWRRMDGSPIANDLLVWKKNQPNNGQGNQYYVLASSEREYLNDAKKTWARASICDLS